MFSPLYNKSRKKSRGSSKRLHDSFGLGQLHLRHSDLLEAFFKPRSQPGLPPRPPWRQLQTRDDSLTFMASERAFSWHVLGSEPISRVERDANGARFGAGTLYGTGHELCASRSFSSFS